MPYSHKQTGPNKVTVTKSDTGEVVGHTTPGKLNAYLAALHIHEPKGYADGGFVAPDTDSVPASAPDSGGFVAPDADTTPGAIESAGRAALRNVPGAQQAVAAIEPGPYAQNLAGLTAKAEAAKAAHPIAYGAGAVGGAAAPMLIPGVGEAMAASYPAAMAGGAALGATGALSDTPLDRNPGAVAKQAASGAVAGGLGGAVGQWLGSLFPTLTEAESGATAQKLGIPGRRIANLLGTDVDEGLSDIAGTLRETPDLNALSDSHLRFAGKVSDAVDNYGKQIGDVVDKIKTDVPMIPIRDTIKGMAVSDNGLAMRNQYLDQIDKVIRDNTDAQGNFSFGKLRDLTNAIYHDMVIEDPQTGRLAPGSEKALEAWKFLRGYQDDIVKSEQPKLFAQFANANKNYSNLVGLRKALNSVALREEATQTKPGSMLNPLGWGTKIGNALSTATGAGRVANNLPFKAMPAVNAVRGALPAAVPQAELADFLSKKFGGQK